MIVLFMVVSFVIGWRSDASVIPFRICLFFHHRFWTCCLWEIRFSSQMISGTAS